MKTNRLIEEILEEKLLKRDLLKETKMRCEVLDRHLKSPRPSEKVMLRITAWINKRRGTNFVWQDLYLNRTT